MCSRLTFRVDRPDVTRRPHGVLGFQRRHTRIVHAFVCATAMRTLAEMRDALAKLDKVVKCAIARRPKNGATPGAVVAMLSVAMGLTLSARAVAAEIADSS